MIRPHNVPIVLLQVLLVHGITAQDGDLIDDELRANGTVKPPVCADPDKYPLFGAGSCISSELYTGIFLGSVILAGASFLTLIALAILYCIRGSKKSSSDKYDDDRGSVSSSRSDSASSSTVDMPPMSKRNNAAHNAIPLGDHARNHGTSSYYDTKGTTSSAPYTATKPVTRQAPPTNVVHKLAEVPEAKPRQAGDTTRFQPYDSHRRPAGQAAQRDRRDGGSRWPDEDKQTSQF